MTSTETVRAGRRTLDIHRPDKAMFPTGGGDREYTKGHLVDYYLAVAPFMLPHLRGRPLMLERHPDGIDGPQFIQKNVPDHYPHWIKRVEVAKEGGTVTHVVCDDTATLAYLAGQACITPHRWSSRLGRLDRPDRLVFDLDPTARDDFGTVREAAHLLGELLSELRLPSALMTTGSRGLHVVVPLGGHHDFAEVRAFARDVADHLAELHPGRLTTSARKKDRGRRLYLDVQRNAYAQTSVAPFAVRAKPGAPVAVPISWAQLDDPQLNARRWTIADALEQANSDPWADLPARGRSLGPARRRLNDLRG
ncbi:non-homologous end-joining DNA ligase [Streptomyces sp. NPDC006333]|uniref:non-homologous end-joining DNA ligase n=1 Tax=Streptomyces sp. NPDC006333 TaxID=3156753 RepID=UPI0033B4019E